ncbi:MAG: hypothetical protein ACFE0O_08995 [Opitutales bacterium]
MTSIPIRFPAMEYSYFHFNDLLGPLIAMGPFSLAILAAIGLWIVRARHPDYDPPGQEEE